MFLLSRTSSNSKVSGILTTRQRRIHSAQRQQQMWSTELGGFFSKFASNIVFRSSSSQISRDLNVSADCICKLLGFDDYVLWSPRTIDRFARSYNAKLPRLNYSILSARLRGSRFSKLGLRQQQLALSSGLSHCQSRQAHEAVPSSGNPCSPPMKSAFFWNAFNRNGVYWNSFVVNWVYLPKFQGLFVPAGLAIPFSNPGP